MSILKNRINLIVIIGGILLFISNIMGTFYFSTVVLIIAGLMLYEWACLFFKNNLVKYMYVLLGILFSLLVITSFSNYLIEFLFIILLPMFIWVIYNDDPRKIKDLFASLFGIIYIATFFPLLAVIRKSTVGMDLVFIVLLTAFLTDTAALIFGKMYGKKKLLPNTSPNKTVEGTVYSLLMGLLVMIFIRLIFGIMSQINWILYIGLIVISLPFIVLGDLLESSIKRYIGVKDSSTWIKGHGGVLDIFDSVIILSPIIYICNEIFM